MKEVHVRKQQRRFQCWKNSNTALGAQLKQVCDDFGLAQRVGKPTRGDYLLDLVLSDCAALASVQVASEIADHRVVLLDVAIATQKSDPVERFVWSFSRANWSSLRTAVATTNWTSIVDSLSVDRAVEAFTEHVFNTAELYTPYQKCSMQKSAHPWLNERCATAVARKCAATGTSGFAAAEQECNSILSEEYHNHVRHLRKHVNSPENIEALV